MKKLFRRPMADLAIGRDPAQIDAHPVQAIEVQDRPRRKVCLLVDPRFSGGTSSAVSQEIPTLAPVREIDLEVRWMRTKHFKGEAVNERLAMALQALGQDAKNPDMWRDKINAHAVVLHNPAALKFDSVAPFRLLCDRLIIVCHENFLRPDGKEGFAVGGVLRMLREAGHMNRRILAPISAWNRQTVMDWLAANPEEARYWEVAERDWFNICEFEMHEPSLPLRDRRGRMSRPGFEKFPNFKDMEACFPATALCNRILGGDSLLADPDGIPDHWDVHPFGAEPVEDFLGSIDIFVYFTNDRWRESFGRVLAEAIAGGKLVVTDPETARIFGPGVVACRAGEVNDQIKALLADQERCLHLIRRAQKDLASFNRGAFVAQAQNTLFENGSKA